MNPVHYEIDDRVGIITIAHPPVNSISAAVRTGIAAALERAQADPTVTAIVLMGAGDAFSGGAEVREFNTPRQLQRPTLPELNALQDRCSKPVVAALAGFAFGGGLELALACHWRIALEGTRMGLPEVRLGLMPGSGGTQRLTRLVPMATAIRMMTTGDPLPAADAHAHGLVDELVRSDLRRAAIAFARSVTRRADGGLRRVRDLAVRDASQATQLIADARAKLPKARATTRAALEVLAACEAAAQMPFDQGLAFERERFLRLLASPDFKGLSHAFFAEREARKVPGADGAGRAIHSTAVVGAGWMGRGIALSLLNAGLPVVLLDTKQEAVERGLQEIRQHYDTEVAKGRLSPATAQERIARVQGTTRMVDVAGADVIIEAAFERMDVKLEIFRALDQAAKPGAILASNTSTLDIDRIAEATTRPQDVIGLHFFSPAHVMRLLEVVRCRRTDPEVLATAMHLGRRLGKVSVVSGVCDGFIGNRMLQKYLQQALFLLDEGCSPQQVDQVMEDWGMAMGPFAVGDLSGLDIGWSVRKRRREEGSTMVYSAIADKICEAGRLGQKTGKGWYRYEPGSRKRLPDPEVDAILERHRAELDIPRRQVSSEEIVSRLILALANEGAHILEEGIAVRASDVDAVWVAGYGFPAHRGGPLFHADTIGLSEVEKSIASFARGYQGDQWAVAPLLHRLASAGSSFQRPR